MKKALFVFLITSTCLTASAQLVARMEMKEHVSGICNDQEVYGLFPNFKGQVESVCPISKEELVKRLNTEVVYLKENPKCKDKGMVDFLINCKGEVVQCRIGNRTKSPELDQQVLAVFKSLNKKWTAGTLDGKEVDSSILYAFKIKKGKITLGY
jgi:hypothetical protein